MTDLAVIVLNYNTKDRTLECLKSIFNENWRSRIQVWVVDNNSNDGTSQAIKKDFGHRVNLIESPVNGGYSAGNNLALKEAQARYYLILNSDTKIKKGALDKLVEFMDQNEFGICSCRLIYPNGQFQPNAGDLPFGWGLYIWIAGLDDFLTPIAQKLPSFHRKYSSYYDHNRQVGWVSGTAMMISDKVKDKIGLLDDQIFMYGEDVEYCLRAKMHGFKIGWTSEAEIVHEGGGSSHDPKFVQWIGEYNGLLYIYKKYRSFFERLWLRLIIYKFTFLRMIAFYLIGKQDFAKTYGKILKNI